MIRNWLVCGNCQTNRGWKGTGYNVEKVNYFTFVLGEIIESGDVLIKKGGNKVRISGGNFSVICDYCGEKVFERKEVTNGTIGTEIGVQTRTKDSGDGFTRIHRESFSGTFVFGTN